MLNKLISNIAIAEQDAKGTPATEPLFITPLAGSGAVAGVDPKVEIDEETGQAYAINAYVDEISSGFDVPTRAYPKTLGLFLKGLFGTATSEQIEEGRYKHTFVVDPIDQKTPWYTIWGNIEDEEVMSSDAKVGAIDISFEGNKPPTVAVTFAVLQLLLGTTAHRPAGGTDMAGLKYLTPANLDFRIDVAGVALETKSITRFSLAMTRNVTPEYFSGTPLAGNLAMGKFEAKPSITTKPDNLADFRKSVTGKESGSRVSADVITGSYELTLRQGEDSLTISASRVPWKIAWPESSASGGAVELPISADNQLGTVEEGPITIVLVNDVPEY